MAAPTLKFKRGALADLPSLAVGEPGFTTDRHQLYVGSDDGNQLIGGGEFWTLNTTTAGSGVKFLEGTNNGSNYVELKAPGTVASNLTFQLPGTDASTSGQVLQSNASGVLSFGDVNVANIDIDGATDIGAAIVDADLFIVDDGATGTNRKTTAQRIKAYVLGGGGGGSTFESVVVGSAVTINNSGIVAAGLAITAATFDGDLTGNVTGAAATFTGNVVVGGTVDGRDIADDGAAIDNLVTLTGVPKDSTNLGSFTGSIIADNETIKGALQDLEDSLAGVAVTFAIAADTGTADVFQTAETLTFSGTAGEVDTAVADNTVTFGLPATVNITTELDVPTVETGAIQAKDGTAAITLADSTGKVTVATDLEAQGTLTATNGAAFQGNTDIGDANTDTLTVTARIDSNLIPTPDATRNLGNASFAWSQGHIDHITGVNNTITGVSTAGTFKGTTIELTGNGTFGGNVNITGNLSVGGSVTNVDIEDLRVVSPVIELGLQRLPNGSLQPPAAVTTKNSGITMYYNHVGINSTNAKIAAMFAKVAEGQDMRIGFATDVVITTVGAGDSVASVNAWAVVEAKGLWINDQAGSSQVIGYSGATRVLENITVDGGAFT